MSNKISTDTKISITDLGLFQSAYNTTKTMQENIKTCQEDINKSKTTLSDESVFMGPIADSCKDALTNIDGFLNTLVENYNAIASYLIESGENYKAGENAAAIKMMSLNENGGVVFGNSATTTITSDNNVPKITVSDVQKCQSVQEYLDLVMPIYSYYCEKYGIKYPGVLALQPVHEHSAPTGIQAQSAVEDNNLGGLKYAEGIPNATPGSVPTDGTGGVYSHFDNVSQYVEAACWNIAHDGSYYQDALAQNNVNDFTTSLVDTWVGHPDNYGSSIIDEYSQYGLDKYEL